MAVTYYALLTTIGAGKLANATALGTTLKITQLAVGDGGGNVPTPDASRTALVNEVRRAPLNQLSVDPANAAQIIAEQVIPEDVGGWWIREMGLYDEAGALIAYANCAPSYKPQLAEGSGRTQTVRMVLIVSNTGAVELKIDPSVVLATRAYVDTSIADALGKLDYKQSARYATTGNVNLSGLATQAGGDWPAALTAGDRVLVKHQATASQNGLYVAAVGAWARAVDADNNAEVTPGMVVVVEAGTLLADTIWQLITDAPIVVDTTALAFQNITDGLLRVSQAASQQEAEGGTEAMKWVSPLRVFQALRSAAAVATESLLGVLRVATAVEVSSGVVDNAAVTPKKLRLGFSVSLGTNGYVVFPSWLGGLVLQWGAATIPSGTGAKNFSLPIAFPNACFEIVASDSGAGCVPIGISPAGLAQFSANRAGQTYSNAGVLVTPGDVIFRYIAIGY
ncbi:phage tail protein [Pseudomonas citronellolis]|uniref:phage tail protein n=1 Tax=Pseudomonas citronellolis TaxID=53408 RepID=UPI000B2917D8|nr:phage tail protein [Pseudomonas citronellolis]